MKKFFKSVLFVFLSMVFFLSGYAREEGEACKRVDGIWLGRVDFQGAALRIVFRISCNNDSLQAVIDSPDQGVKDIPVTAISFSDDTLSIKSGSIMASYTGRINMHSDTITGEWKQAFLSLPLVMVKVDSVPGLNRPQEPKPPYPYVEQEVVFENMKAGIKLAGTLTLPDTNGVYPAVVLISGSGPQDRNQEITGHKPFLVIADHLTRQGIAVLRYDDRGVAGSEGVFNEATTVDFADDADAAWLFLTDHKNINPKNVGLVGHSEGGMIAPMVAANRKEVAFIVLLAAPGVTGEKILLRQTELIYKASGMDEEVVEGIVKRNGKIYSILKKIDDEEKAAKKIRKILEKEAKKIPDQERGDHKLKRYEIDAQVKTSVSPWFRNFVNFDPQPYLKSVSCPVLALNGELDLQVAANENLLEIEKAMIIGANPNYKVMEIPGLNHLFQHATTGSPAEYATIEETFSKEVLMIIERWILEEVP